MSETRTKPSTEATRAAEKILESIGMVPQINVLDGRDKAYSPAELIQAAEIIDDSHRELRECLRKVVAWDKKWPKTYIMNEGGLRDSEKELDAICGEAEKLLEGK